MAEEAAREFFGFRIPEQSTRAVFRRVEGMGDDPLPLGALLGPVLVFLALVVPIGAPVFWLLGGDPAVAFVWPMVPFIWAHISGVRLPWWALVAAGIVGWSTGEVPMSLGSAPP